MKKHLTYVCAASFVILVNGIFAQGTFQNLDFEQATVPFVPPGQFGADVTVSNGLPNRVAYFNSFQISTIPHDDVALGDAAVSLHDTSSGFNQPIQGSFSVLLQGSGSGPPHSAAIGQTGQVPAGAASVRFWADPRSNLQVTFGGQGIVISRLGSTPGYDVFGGDISPFAGQTAELRFIGPGNSGGYFDNIFFSAQPIPEPSTFGLFTLGALLLGWRFLCKRT